MIHMKKLFNDHPLLCIYSVVFIFLCLGVFVTSGGIYFPMLFCFLVSIYSFYILGYKILKKKQLKLPNVNSIAIPEILLAVIILLFLGHVISMNGLPAFECIEVSQLSKAVELRKNITTRAHPIWNYISSISIKALIPFALVLFYRTNRKYAYWIVAVLGCVYAFTLMQKSHVLSVFIPLIILFIYERKWIQVLKFSMPILIVIASLVYVTNPQIRGGDNDLSKTESTQSNSNKNVPFRVIISLSNRVFIVPGEMVSEWFRCIPDEKPYLNGNGYEFYSKLNHSEFHDYATELYPLIRPELAKKGIQGSVNVASFMREYSNFGLLGLILSGLITALFFLFIENIFKASEIKIKLSLNLFFVFLLSSGSLSTLLLSGGWFFMILLFFVFKNQLNGINAEG